MAKLSLKLNGVLIKTLELQPGQEYTAGRSPDCDFPLDDHRGISRQHLKFFENSGVWCCESLSKFLHPKLGEENFDSLEMNESVSFSLFPYEFEFELEENEKPETENFAEPQANENPPEQALVPVGSPTNESHLDEPYSSDATAVGTIQLNTTLRICYPSSSDNETLKLEGEVWTAGREADCEIQLHNPKVSRRHFELTKNPSGHYITDLGSSNGTFLNGHRLPPHEPTRLNSGDLLKVLDIELHFEIKASNLPAVTAQPMNLPQVWLSQMPVGWPPPSEYEATQVGSIPTLENAGPQTWSQKVKNFDWKKNKVRVALGAMVPILIFALFSGSDPESKKSDLAKESKDNLNFENLSPEQKMAIKDSLGLAQNLYVQGKYSLCLAELAKLHETIPFYNNSKELESFCIQGHELTQRKLDNDRKEREKAMVEQKIVDIVDICSEKHKDQGTVSEIRNCLTEAIELDPEHPRVVELVQRAEDRKREKTLLAEQQKAAAQKRKQILSLLHVAQNYRKKGQLIKARSSYENFISKADGSLQSEKNQARRELASVSKNLKEKVSLLMEKCQVLGDAEKFKEAFYACDKAIQEDPSAKQAYELKDQYASVLRRKMKAIYQDAKLEESLGNLEAAKEKWKKIRSEDLESGDFHQKSTLKLRQYGAL